VLFRSCCALANDNGQAAASSSVMAHSVRDLDSVSVLVTMDLRFGSETKAHCAAVGSKSGEGAPARPPAARDAAAGGRASYGSAASEEEHYCENQSDHEQYPGDVRGGSGDA